MDLSFNLVDEPWIPTVDLRGGTQMLSLSDTLSRAHDLGAVYHGSPLVTASLYRLLLALLHRIYGPSSNREWVSLMQGGWFPEPPLSEYLTAWRRRFDLFDSRHPFFQTTEFPADVPQDQDASVVQLLPEYARGSNPTLFDHTTDDDPPALSPAEAARRLLSTQAFLLGGLSSLVGPRGRQNYIDAPSARAATFLLSGRTLFETLMLNLMRYDPHAHEPLPAFGPDLPVWERDRFATEDVPAGYLDYLTWQTLRLRLIPDQARHGVTVSTVAIGMGRTMRNGLDHPLTWRRKRGNYNVPFRFEEGHALWRDSGALLAATRSHDVAEGEAPPRNLSFIREIVEQEPQSSISPLRLMAFGMSARQRKVNFWRREQVPVPLSLLREDKAVADLQAAIKLAQVAAEAVRVARFRAVAELVPFGGQGAQTLQRNLAGHLGGEAEFWSRLEVPFYHFVERLGTAYDDHNGEPADALGEWWMELRRLASSAFDDSVEQLQGSAKSLKGIVRGRATLNGRLAQAGEVA